MTGNHSALLVSLPAFYTATPWRLLAEALSSRLYIPVLTL